MSGSGPGQQEPVARCPWSGSDPLYQAYHDHEWGRPQHDDQHLFEMLILEGVQAGLSWITVLRKRANYRAAYQGFDPRRVARFTPQQAAGLLLDSGLIRNRLKIQASITNARAFLKVQAEHRTFAHYLWSFVRHVQQVNRFTSMSQVPARTELSDRLSQDLKQRGFAFVGSTICYAYCQAVGLVNDHLVSCFCHPEHPGFKRVDSSISRA
jgi:DNA-3-methyladenine glycosylase I